MGLDMYLNKRTFVLSLAVMGDPVYRINGKDNPLDLKRVKYIVEEIGYWRKANCIHAWFVNNCQNGTDDCRDAYVSEEDLKTLLELCKEVKAHPRKAKELLPTQSGFFFGSLSYEDDYKQDIEDTINILEKALAEDMSNAEYSYHSSW